jgi:phosphatidylinositol glycan class N
MAQLRTLVANASVNADLDKQLRQDKVVFFLHLLGLDTTGHSYRPHSVVRTLLLFVQLAVEHAQEYMNNIKVVDQIAQETEALMSSFYGDAETAFIFTADHGMSVIGNHGDGRKSPSGRGASPFKLPPDPDNTRTPLIAWGKGVRGPIPDSAQSSHDVYSRSWDLGHLYRRDVEQADVAALMAALIGVDWPVNSVGVLPDVDGTKPGYLSWADGEPRKTAEAALVNGKVLIEHYRVKHSAPVVPVHPGVLTPAQTSSEAKCGGTSRTQGCPERRLQDFQAQNS